ncbi:NAD-specific glutamate dehydrogenase [Priestia megaterium]
MVHGLAQQTIDSIAVRLAGVALVVENHRHALVGGFEDGLRFRNHAQQGHREDFLDVFDAEHFAVDDARRVVAGQQQVFLDRVFAVFGATGLAGQQAQHAVRVTYGGDFRVGHDDRFVSEVHGQVGTFLDTGRGVADHEFEVFFQLHQDFFYAFLGQRVFVAGLTGGQHVEVFQALVFDQGLLQVGFAVHHVDEVIHHAALATHDQVEVTQADVEVDDNCFVTTQSEAGTDSGAGGGLTHTTLAGCNHENLGQGVLPLRKKDV